MAPKDDDVPDEMETPELLHFEFHIGGTYFVDRKEAIQNYGTDDPDEIIRRDSEDVGLLMDFARDLYIHIECLP